MAGVHHNLRFTAAIAVRLKRRAADKGHPDELDNMLELDAMQAKKLADCVEEEGRLNRPARWSAQS